jgi:hypothetical protein
LIIPIGLNPVWREKFKFRLDVPDLAILELRVSSSSIFLFPHCILEGKNEPQK